MKNPLSLLACFIICAVMVQYRTANSDLMRQQPPLKVTVWDAFGYYAYLPATLIYHDCTRLQWLDSIDKKYAVTGGDGYQAQKAGNGNYVFKYLGGVAILELPFFLAAHVYARHSHYPPDGFSPPYQYALGFGVILYCFLAILLLRKILLYYFTDQTTAVTLAVICLATNFLQYAAVDNGQSHGYIFPLYVLVMYTTIRWHRQPRAIWALLTGLVIGLATISRPTEAIMLFIPLFWDTHSREAAQEKWKKVRDHRSQIILAALGGLAGILPQLLYWKSVTGSFVYDVGSKWEFLSPHFRVLAGWEKGWFIYTPVTILFIEGMFFMKRFPFRKSVLWFCLLNIYIIIAWHDWRYGGSYSARALVQSYPMFALPFAAITERVSGKKWRILYFLVCAYFLGVNLFQTNQYNTTVLHFNDMNRLYYGHIYLNAHPTPIDMSLLDHDEILKSEEGFKKTILENSAAARQLHADANGADTVARLQLPTIADAKVERWLKVMCIVRAPGCLWQSYLHADLGSGALLKSARVRLFNAISKDSLPNVYAFYVRVPAGASTARVYITSPFTFNGVAEKVAVLQLVRTD